MNGIEWVDYKKENNYQKMYLLEIKYVQLVD